MRNEPSNTNQCPVERPETPPPSSPTEDSEDVYSLPAPEEAPDPTRCPRVPPPRPPPVLEGVDLELEISDSTPPAILLSNHMVRLEYFQKIFFPPLYFLGFLIPATFFIFFVCYIILALFFADPLPS